MRAERLNAMEQYILGKETVSLEELSTQFSVSMNTIRRDVMELLSRGNIRKSLWRRLFHPDQPAGGLFCPGPEKQPGQADYRTAGLPTGQRWGVNFSGLRFHNALYPSAYRREKRRYRDYPQLDCAVCGLVFVQPEHYCAGRYLRPATSSFTGISTLDALSRLSIQTIFISATGVSIENGLTNSTYLEAEIKRSVVQRGNRVVLMADQSKFGHSAVISFCPFEQLYAIVTDCLPSEPYLEAIDRYGIRLICPGHESD